MIDTASILSKNKLQIAKYIMRCVESINLDTDCTTIVLHTACNSIRIVFRVLVKDNKYKVQIPIVYYINYNIAEPCIDWRNFEDCTFNQIHANRDAFTITFIRSQTDDILLYCLNGVKQCLD